MHILVWVKLGKLRNHGLPARVYTYLFGEADILHNIHDLELTRLLNCLARAIICSGSVTHSLPCFCLQTEYSASTFLVVRPGHVASKKAAWIGTLVCCLHDHACNQMEHTVISCFNNKLTSHCSPLIKTVISSRTVHVLCREGVCAWRSSQAKT